MRSQKALPSVRPARVLSECFRKRLMSQAIVNNGSA